MYFIHYRSVQVLPIFQRSQLNLNLVTLEHSKILFQTLLTSVLLKSAGLENVKQERDISIYVNHDELSKQEFHHFGDVFFIKVERGH